MRIQTSFVLSLMMIIIGGISLTHADDILVAMFMPTFSSHTKGLSAIAGALTRRGHNVTLLSSSEAGTQGFQRNTYNRTVQYKFDPGPGDMGKNILKLAFEKSTMKKLRALGKAFYFMRYSCESFFDDHETLALLKESRFDILIGDSFDSCDTLLSNYLGLPNIAVTTSTRYPFFNEHLYGIPSPSSYVPFGLFPLSDRMPFIGRVQSFLEHHIVIPLLGRTHFRALRKVKDEHGIAPGRSIQELIGGAELWMCMTNLAFEYSHPTAPNWIPIGNIADVPAKPLEKEFKDFVDSSGEHGFIVFTMGTYFTDLPDQEMAEAFARVFSELPQKVFWRYTGPRPRHLGNNTMIVDSWMPQNDLIGHPNARLLIYHGGIAGITEAIYHAVPLVIMPIFAEQRSNAIKVEMKGIGTRILRETFSYETVKEALTEVINNSIYKENIRRLSKLYRHRLSDPDETIVYWVEHILEFGGSHLKSRALELNFIQLHSIDVIAFIIGIVIVIVFILIACCKRCITCCFKSKKTKTE